MNVDFFNRPSNPWPFFVPRPVTGRTRTLEQPAYETGREEPSAFQEHYPPWPPRKYFRLTAEGRAASPMAWANPLLALYGERWGGVEAAREHNRHLQRQHKYSRARPRQTPRLRAR